MEQTLLELSKFVSQILFTIAGAFLAAWLAMKRYRADKWWDKKEAAYSDLINALHQMKWPASEHIDAEYERRVISDEDNAALWQEFKMARRNVWRIAESSSFLLPPSVLTAVQEMERGLGTARSTQSWLEHLDREYAAIDKCVQDIKSIGQHDLGFKGK